MTDKNSNRMKKKCFNKYMIISGAIILCLIVYIGIVMVIPQMKLFCKTETICEVVEDTVPLKRGRMISQEFTMPVDRLGGLELYFISSVGNNTGNIEIELTDDSKNTLYSWEIREALLISDGFHKFELDNVTDVVKGGKYTVTVYSNDNDEVVSAVGISSSDVNSNGELSIDGQNQNGDLAIRVFGMPEGANQKYLFTIIYVLFAAIFVWCFYNIMTYKTSAMMKLPEKCDWLLVIILAVICAVFISQYNTSGYFNDLKLTINHSEDLISAVKNGDFFQFYDIVFEKSINGGYNFYPGISGAYYNILLYVILAVIIFPWVLMRKLFSFQYSYESIAIYVELVLVFFDVYAAFLLSKVCEAFGCERKHAKLVSYLFLGSSITLFATVGFGQLDIIYVLIMLSALCFFAKGQYYRFSLVMAVAVMLKLFPLLLFIPLVLLTNKRIIEILKNFAIGLSGLLLSKLLFSSSYGYTLTQEKLGNHYNFMGRLINSNVNGGLSVLALFIVIFAIVCIWAYNKTVENKEEIYSYMIYIGLIVYGTFAILVLWHPQWLVLMTVFIAMAIPAIRNTKVMIYCDLVLQVMYILIVNVYFVNNVDNYMINGGILPQITGHLYSGITVIELAGLIDSFLPIIFSLFAGTLIAIMGLVYRQLNMPEKLASCYTCERIPVWSRSAVMYGYILMLCFSFFYLG